MNVNVVCRFSLPGFAGACMSRFSLRREQDDENEDSMYSGTGKQ